MWWATVRTAAGILSVVLAVCFVKLGAGESIRFTLSAKYLPEMDLGGYNDPYVNIYAKDSYARHYRKVAQTRIQHGARNPRWPEVFDYYFIKGAGQKLKFTIRDWDFGWNQDDDLGKVEISVEDLVTEIRKIHNGTRARVEDAPTSIKLHLMKPRGGVLIVTPMTFNGTHMSAPSSTGNNYNNQHKSAYKTNKKTKEPEGFDLTK